MLFLLRCFYGILFYFTCVGYFNLTYLGTLIPSFIWEENRNNSFVAERVTNDSLFIGFFFFPFFFVGSKLNLITAFEVFLLQKNVLLYMQSVSWRSSILCHAWLNEIFTFFFGVSIFIIFSCKFLNARVSQGICAR